MGSEKSDKRLFDILDQAMTSCVEESSTLILLYEEAEFLLLRIKSLEKENQELEKEASNLREELDKLKEVEKAATVFLDAVKSKKTESVSAGIKKLHTAIHKKPKMESEPDPNQTMPPVDKKT